MRFQETELSNREVAATSATIHSEGKEERAVSDVREDRMADLERRRKLRASPPNSQDKTDRDQWRRFKEMKTANGEVAAFPPAQGQDKTDRTLED